MVNRSEGALGELGGRRRGMRRGLGLGVVGILAATLLSACGERGEAHPQLVHQPRRCRHLRDVRRRVQHRRLRHRDPACCPPAPPTSAIQLARRLAAEDSSTDLMNLDPVFVRRVRQRGLAGRGHRREHRGQLASTIAESAEGEGDYLAGAADTVTWDDGVFAIPLWANTQVLWYRKSLAEAAGLDMPDQPVTWEQVIKAAADNNGSVGVQANKYEAYVVWINALIQGAGGDIVSNTEAGTRRQGRHRLRRRPARRRDHPDAGRLPGRPARPLGLQRGHQPGPDVPRPRGPQGAGEFMVNWTFVYKNYEGLIGAPGGPADEEQFERPRLRALPADASRARTRSRPIGGIDIGVGAYSRAPGLRDGGGAVHHLDSRPRSTWRSTTG